MNKLIKLFSRLLMMFSILPDALVSNINTIHLRSAHSTDLANIIIFDRAVTYEFFKPLYQNHYVHLELGKNPDPFLEKELASDEQEFKEALNDNDKGLLVAADGAKIVGLILFHTQENILYIDILIIDKNYRNQGIGKKLMHAMFDACPQVCSCIVYPLKFGNAATLAFYENLGFVNQGIAPADMKNIYGISYADMYWFYILDFNNFKPK